ncbi:alcohol dehydrogenase catalytic domain-containing protein [Microbacterium sp. M3]|uniref:Alcohol dehydrogenase catalytic domain-containing protein n=1 Tax=Microbacterium arthrosphaerae TaxID=792652 RepID=A0ABU4H2I3_9MICO|nr:MULTISPECIES: alcohol dehydrogenase catalytic domain-containing protein [Microbacterium]MDW4573546.1 alcohol dehydrogenase catalytic domain-containing protein [Microbacterium arthrosphaerae]MDW7607401.1 alcohol dehydrogenase catalytic domain-containing protein [Microbacterium sp. M3]
MRITAAVLEVTGAEAPFARTHPFTVGDLELDPPGPGELLVRIEAAGVCHSDLSVVDGNRVRPVPMLLGHEAAGIVEQVGDGVDDLVPGTRVVMTFLPRCGDCDGCRTDGRLPCTPGSAANAAGTLLGGGIRLHRERDGDAQDVHHHLGVSAFATHAVVNRASVVPVDPDVPPEIAALLGCAVLTGGGAVINAARPAPQDRVIVVGLGGVGMAALLVAVALGHEVIGVDTVPAKLEHALACGAIDAVTPAHAVDHGIHAPVVIEAAGAARAFETALAVTAPGGTTVTVGLPAPDARASVSPLVLTAEARTIIGSYLGSAVPSRDIPRYVELWRAGRLPLERLVSSRIRLDDLDAAMDRLAAGGELRQLIVFDPGSPTEPDSPTEHDSTTEPGSTIEGTPA